MKAKDLRGKNIEDIEEVSDSGEPEEDQVAAAYENISKRLENIRKEKEDEKGESEEKEDEIELEEWKGPRPPKLDEIDEDIDAKDIKHATLRNLEDSQEDKKSGDDEEEDSDKEEEKDFAEEDETPVKEKWAPKENDPLDDEESGDLEDESEGKEESLEEEKTERADRFESEKNFEETAVDEEPGRQDPQPDTLDDLAQDSREHSRPMAGGSEDEDEYYIPNLKSSRQNGNEMEYNTHPQRGSIGESYSPKGNYMEGNDPNNFFSQHQQPQPPKRANKFHLLVLVIIGVVVIGFTVYILKGGFGELNIGTNQPTPAPSAEPSVEPTPTATPEPEIERGDFTVKVLNGTSTTGLARTVSDQLKEAGFKTANPGNASGSDVEQTEVRVKEGTESAVLLQRLILDLAPDYEAVAGDTLDESVSYDAEIIIGAK